MPRQEAVRQPGRATESSSAPYPWLSIVGVGADGHAGLPVSAAEEVARAEVVFGSRRQLEVLSPLIRGERVVWPSPFSEGLRSLLARRGRPTCVLASGDPFYFGVGSTLSRELLPEEFRCWPAASSVSLASAALGWALQDVTVVSLHGRPVEEIVAALEPGRRVLALTSDGSTPDALLSLLRHHGLHDSRIAVLEDLGAATERVQQGVIRDFSPQQVSPLNIVALEVENSAASHRLAAGGIADDSSFESAGQITKQEVRALTLLALRPRPGALLWDLGAGSGSISIAWMCTAPSSRAIAVERDPTRCARIRRNALHHGVPRLEIVEGEALSTVDRLPDPDAVFVGGGASRELIDACWRALPRGGRLVANGVLIDTQSKLAEWQREFGGGLRRISIESAHKLGRDLTWKAAYPIVQWEVVKPW